ncbi:TetR/AcrR family transcriptional regulator [Streptomyces phytophilus]|uniref:TetR/AcrR family transcriptional regulator n=1 Tax=Streptomyces phytophilus TaxID=722715 RepID=UPI0015F00B43|nr:TetR/AcrR family transcriptional regulator [Streptomyces phytophilus]
MARTPGANVEETRARIYKAALRLFARHGFQAVGIRAIAQEAGLTTGALYYHMGTKEDLLMDIMKSTMLPLTETCQRALEVHDRPEQQLAAITELHVWVHGGRGTATMITDTEVRALSDPHLFEIMKLRDEYEGVWRTVMDNGVAEGVFDVPDAGVATIALLELVTGAAHWYRPGGRLPLIKLCEVHADLALGTVRAHRGNRPVRRSDLTLEPPGKGLPLDVIGPDVPLSTFQTSSKGCK